MTEQKYKLYDAVSSHQAINYPLLACPLDHQEYFSVPFWLHNVFDRII